MTFRWLIFILLWFGSVLCAQAQDTEKSQHGAAKPGLPSEAGQSIQQSLSGAVPVSLEADQLDFDQASATYQASGGVVLRKGAVTLVSDQIRWNDASGTARAEGHVFVTEPGGTLSADRLNMHLESGSGSLTNGRVFIREHNFHMTGTRIERFDELHYRVSEGAFTTCDGDVPAWKFGAKRLDVTLGGYARAKHVLFYLRDIPVLYMPYLAYPVKTERESGFLLPRYGYSEKRGAELSLAYYQVLGRNMDATFFLDYLSDLGVGKGLEYRYVIGEDNEGQAKLYHINGLENADNRYAFDWTHQGSLPGRVQMAADVEYVSSRDYFEDFGEIAEEYNKDKAESVVRFGRNWRKHNLTGQLKYTKDLEQDNDQTLQRLPEISYNALRTRLGDSSLFTELEGTYTYFWRREPVAGLPRGHRVNIRPALVGVFQPGRVVDLELEAGYRERLYWASGEGPGQEREGIYDLGATLSSRVSRVFHRPGRYWGKIRHSIEPEVSYSYVPNENQAHLPQFDAQDNIEPENRFAYSLTNRMTARIDPENGERLYHDFLYLRLSQEYDIRESQRDRTTLLDRRRPFSDLRTELLVRPTTWSYIDLDTRFDVFYGQGGFNSVNARGGLEDGAGNGLSLDYRFTRGEIEYLGGVLNTALLRPVYLNYQYRYDFEDGTTLENVLSLEYRAQCWSVFLTLRDRLEDREYLVSFALSGLGKVAKFGGDLGRPSSEP